MNDLLFMYNQQEINIKVSRRAEYLKRHMFPIEQHHTVSSVLMQLTFHKLKTSRTYFPRSTH